MDLTVIYSGLGDLVALGATAIAAVAARQSNKSSGKANETAGALAGIEQDRRRSELTPRFRVRCEPWNEGDNRHLRMRIMLLGPAGLDRVDRLTVTIRDDHFQRGAGTLTAGGPSREEVKEQIWGPYRFRPGTGPADEALADRTGRTTVYDAQLPIGEELTYLLERTTPPHWSTGTSQESWDQERGSVIRLGLAAGHADHGNWYLPCEIDLAVHHEPNYAGWVIYLPQF